MPTKLPVPAGDAVTVRIIDSTSSINNMKANVLMGPEMPGLEYLTGLCTWSFLIEHSSGQKVLFDLGIPVDLEDFRPVADRLKQFGWDAKVQKSTVEILKEQAIKSEDINAIVWSHWHWDHVGNPSHFPPSTKLVVGPGFKEEFFPAYPTNPEGKVREVDFEGRELLEIKFTEPQAMRIGQFKAYDWFGDGSFYLLDTPGHATGHIAGLARTTSTKQGDMKDTFIFMGGDLTHHSGELRPSEHLPIPSHISCEVLPKLCKSMQFDHSCPGEIFHALLTTRDRKLNQSFFDPAMGDVEECIRTIKKTQVADADDDCLYVFAHDPHVREVADLYPSKANEWREKGWAEKLKWRFLEEFEEAVKLANEKQGKL